MKIGKLSLTEWWDVLSLPILVMMCAIMLGTIKGSLVGLIVALLLYVLSQGAAELCSIPILKYKNKTGKALTRTDIERELKALRADIDAIKADIDAIKGGDNQ